VLQCGVLQCVAFHVALFDVALVDVAVLLHVCALRTTERERESAIERDCMCVCVLMSVCERKRVEALPHACKL